MIRIYRMGKNAGLLFNNDIHNIKKMRFLKINNF